MGRSHPWHNERYEICSNILKPLFGLKSSGKRWAEVIHGIMRDMKFTPSKADPCIWLRKAPNLTCYEYIAVYVDDLCLATESPSAIIDTFKTKHHLKFKGDGKLRYHLCADYFENPDGTLLANLKNTLIRLSQAECSIPPFSLFQILFQHQPPFFPNYFSIISLSANSNPIRT